MPVQRNGGMLTVPPTPLGGTRGIAPGTGSTASDTGGTATGAQRRVAFSVSERGLGSTPILRPRSGGQTNSRAQAQK